MTQDQELVASHDQITSLLAFWARSVDLGDAVGIESCYAAGATHSQAGFTGTPHDFAARVVATREHEAASTMHSLSQQLIDVVGESAARAETYCIIYRRLQDAAGETVETIAWTRFVDLLAREPGKPWLISSRTAITEWSRVNRRVLVIPPSISDGFTEKVPHGQAKVVGQADAALRQLTPGTSPDQWTAEAALARQGIRDTISRFARGIDRRDDVLAASCFATESRYSSPEFEGSGSAYVAHAIEAYGPQRTQHALFQSLIAVPGSDIAIAETYAGTFRRLGEGPDAVEDRWVRSRYVDRLALGGDGRWLITSRVVVPVAARIDPVTGQRPITDDYARGHHDLADPIYAKLDATRLTPAG